MQKENSRLAFIRTIFIHVVGWIFITDLFFGISEMYQSWNNEDFLYKDGCFDDHFIMLPIIFFFFYWNTEFLFPRFFRTKTWWQYFLALIISAVVLVFFAENIEDYMVKNGWIFEEEFVQYTIEYLLLIIGGSSSLGAYRMASQNVAEKLEAEEKQKIAEFKYLMAQFNPHFLFNTLNGIYALSTEEEAEKTTAAILKLSEIMRYPINQGTKKTVSLIDEIQFIEQYIDLQRLRLGKKYPIHFIKTGNFQGIEVMPLCYIPLVENAFKYGISQRKKTPIHLSIQVEGNKIYFESKNQITQSKDVQSHLVGLENLEARLRLRYGTDYHLDNKLLGDEYIVTLSIQL